MIGRSDQSCRPKLEESLSGGCLVIITLWSDNYKITVYEAVTSTVTFAKF